MIARFKAWWHNRYRAPYTVFVDYSMFGNQDDEREARLNGGTPLPRKVLGEARAKWAARRHVFFNDCGQAVWVKGHHDIPPWWKEA